MRLRATADAPGTLLPRTTGLPDFFPGMGDHSCRRFQFDGVTPWPSSKGSTRNATRRKVRSRRLRRSLQPSRPQGTCRPDRPRRSLHSHRSFLPRRPRPSPRSPSRSRAQPSRWRWPRPQRRRQPRPRPQRRPQELPPRRPLPPQTRRRPRLRRRPRQDSGVRLRSRGGASGAQRRGGRACSLRAAALRAGRRGDQLDGALERIRGRRALLLTETPARRRVGAQCALRDSTTWRHSFWVA